MKEFLHTQLGLLDKKITHLQKLRQTMQDVEKMMGNKEVKKKKIQALKKKYPEKVVRAALQEFILNSEE